MACERRGGARRQVALDGEVVWGEALVSSEHVTGEAAPARARPGARLPAGARNHDGVLVLAATAAAAESTPARIARLTATAQARTYPNPNLGVAPQPQPVPLASHLTLPCCTQAQARACAAGWTLSARRALARSCLNPYHDLTPPRLRAGAAPAPAPLAGLLRRDVLARGRAGRGRRLRGPAGGRRAAAGRRRHARRGLPRAGPAHRGLALRAGRGAARVRVRDCSHRRQARARGAGACPRGAHSAGACADAAGGSLAYQVCIRL